MLRRFEHPWSSIYYHSLNDVQVVPTDIPHDEPDFERKAQYASDHDFLSTISQISASNPSWNLPNLIPKLMLAARSLPQRGSPFSFYNGDTCTEYHMFLCLLLKKFQNHIYDLHTLTNPDTGSEPSQTPTQPQPPMQQPTTQPQPQPAPPAGPPDIRLLVARIFKTGYTLWKMARGRAFEIHILNIISLLADPRSASSSSSNGPGISSQQDCTEDLHGTIPQRRLGDPALLWKAYRDWVLLMVVHFEAVSTMRQFVRSENYDHQPIRIKVLLGPNVTSDILPLDDLFASPLFPGDPIENETIAQFIKNAMSAKKQYDFSVIALSLWQSHMVSSNELYPARKLNANLLTVHLTNMCHADPARRHTDFVTETKDWVYDWLLHPTIIGKVVEVKKDKDILPLPELIASISNNLESMVSSLSEDLACYGPAANLSLHFQGSLHCETCLAALLDPLTRESLVGDDNYKDIMENTEVGLSFNSFS